MARRKPYTKLTKANFVRPDHVKGQGDKSYRGFQCLNSTCTEHIFAPEPLAPDFQIACPACGYVHEDGGSTKFFDFRLEELDSKTREATRTIEDGEFVVLHSEYLAEAKRYKYCILCSTLKPLCLFDAHGSRRTGRQGECNLCKGIYNAIKNQTRLGDQHREAAQKRRLYIEISGDKGRIDSKEIFERFGSKCFYCEKPLADAEGKPLQGEFNIDHTLPAIYLWPASTLTASLLCSTHNNEKKGKWPGDYYNEKKLRALAVITGIKYEVLRGKAHINPAALEILSKKADVDKLLVKYAKYRDDLIGLRNRVLRMAGLDIFSVSDQVSPSWVDEANLRLKKKQE